MSSNDVYVSLNLSKDSDEDRKSVYVKTTEVCIVVEKDDNAGIRSTVTTIIPLCFLFTHTIYWP